MRDFTETHQPGRRQLDRLFSVEDGGGDVRSEEGQSQDATEIGYVEDFCCRESGSRDGPIARQPSKIAMGFCDQLDEGRI